MATLRKGLSESIGSLAKSVDVLSSKLTKVDALTTKTGDDFKKFGEKSKAGTEAASKGIQKVADVLGQARAIGKDAFAGIGTSIASISKGDALGTMMGLVDTVAALSQGLDLLIPGLGQATSALIKFASGGIGLLYELGQKTIEENQHLTEMKNAFGAIGSRFGETGEGMLKHFEDLSSELPFTRAKLAEMAEPMIEAGIQGDKLASAIRSQAAATAMLGEKGGQAYAGLAQRARDAQRAFSPLSVSMKDLLKTGLSESDMAKELGISVDQLDMQLRFGAFNAKQFGDALDNALQKKGASAIGSLSTMVSTAMAKTKEKIGMLFQFSDSDSKKGLEDFGKSLDHFSSLFDQSTASGKMLHDTLHDIFESVLSKAGTILSNARVGFKMLELVWMKLVIAGDPLFISLGKLNEELGKSGHKGLTFEQALKGIAAAARVAANAMAGLVDAATKVAEVGNKISSNKAGSAATHGIVSSALGAINPVVGAMHLLGHQHGGIVTGVHNGLATVSPAPGEGLTSIGRGERIVPSGKSSEGGWHVVFEAGAVVIQKSGAGRADADLTEEALSLVFERLRLKQGAL